MEVVSVDLVKDFVELHSVVLERSLLRVSSWALLLYFYEKLSASLDVLNGRFRYHSKRAIRILEDGAKVCRMVNDSIATCREDRLGCFYEV